MPGNKQINFNEEVLKILIPEEYLKDFEPNSVENKPTEWVIELIEKEDRIPQALAGKEAVLDGYNNEIDILTHAFSNAVVCVSTQHSSHMKDVKKHKPFQQQPGA